MGNKRKEPASDQPDDGSGTYSLNSDIFPLPRDKQARKIAKEAAIDLLQKKIKELS